MSRLNFPPASLAITTKTEYTYEGRTLTLMQWAKEIPLPYNTLRQRFVRGVRGADLFKKDHLSVGHHRGVKYSTTYKGETISLRELSKHPDVDITYDTLRQRHRAGLTGADLINPERKTKTNIPKEPITYMGLTMTLKQWAKRLDIQYGTLRARYVRGQRGDELFAEVDQRYGKGSELNTDPQ